MPEVVVPERCQWLQDPLLQVLAADDQHTPEDPGGGKQEDAGRGGERDRGGVRHY